MINEVENFHKKFEKNCIRNNIEFQTGGTLYLWVNLHCVFKFQIKIQRIYVVFPHLKKKLCLKKKMTNIESQVGIYSYVLLWR